MNQERVNHSLILHAHQSLTDALDLDTVTSDFVEGNERRLHLFG